MNQITKDRMRVIITKVRVIHFRLICALLWLLILGDSNAVLAQCRAHPEIAPRISEPVANTSALVTQGSKRAPDIIALTTDNKLVRFNSADPTTIINEVPITDLQPGETIIAIDYNPSDGFLYGLGTTGRLYFIDERRGLVSQTANGPFFSNKGTKIGFDFDPLRNLARMVGDTGTNDYWLAMPANQYFAPSYQLGGGSTLANAIGDINMGHKPNVVSLAYDNNFAGTAFTTAYAIDSELDTLVRLGSVGGNPISADSGQLFTVGPLGINTTNSVGFDIAAGSNVAYASLTSSDETVSKLYSINLRTGAATLVGTIGGARMILDVTVAPVAWLTLDPPNVYGCWYTGIVKESDGRVAFSISRSGNTSGAATVDYVPVQAINIKEGTNVVGTFGRVYFAPGEVSKSFSVFLIDDANVEGGGDLTITLTRPTSGNFRAGGTSPWELLISDNDKAPSATNPIDDARFFVREHYIDFLHREPDSAGLQFWMDQITSCGTDQQCLQDKRQNVSAAFFLSTEFQQTGYLVYRFYKASFGRIPQLTEFLPDKQVISQDAIVNSPGWEQQLEKNKIAFADFWMDRPDFKNLYDDKTNAQYVDALIANTGVAFSQADRDALVNGLDNTTETRASVLRKVVENQTLAQQEFNRAFVLMQYFGYLRRNPNDAPDSDFSGYTFWLNKLNAFNGDFAKAEMVKAFITSAEYRKRFGP